ncbi:MAG: hypothetical protein JWN74_2948 [Acidobacteriaceae bacterium]|nr:hypothetical protein [Acidobacteriaceae bacterium]
MANNVTRVLLAAVAAIGISGALPAQQSSVSQTHPTDDGSVTGNRARRQHVLARQKWQTAGRKLPGANSASLRARAIRQKLQMRATRALASTSTTRTWVSLGPKPLPSDASGTGLQDYGFVSGRATAIAIDPNDPSGNTVYAGGAYAGVWKSTNAGVPSESPAAVTWTPLTDGQATLAIGAIAVQRQLSNPDPTKSVVLVGTGETDSSADSYYGLGILRSGDGGQTWALISQDVTGTHSFAGLGFSQIAFSTGDPNLVVAAAASTSEGIFEGLENRLALNRRLYYSTNAGIDWQAAATSDSGVGITPASVTAVAYNASASVSSFYAAIRFHGFYSSPDGIKWTRLATQPGSGLGPADCPAQAVSPSTCPIYRGGIAVVPNPASASILGEMYAWYVDANGVDQGIWKSLDAGASWTQIDDSGITNCGDFFGGCGTAQGTSDLTLAAVPNGPATDLYAGAVNIYKCTITDAFPSCNGAGNNTFLNLTHAYGCSDIARVHPNQHAMDFLLANQTALLYFANDGGIYRALDGYTGLTTGACGLSNQFDNLNQSLGPMTQFVSVSQSSSDANLIFGGTQDNGAPATTSSHMAGGWVSVNAGDNGFTAINQANQNEWFVATPPDSISGVNLFRCTSGVNCHSLDFQNDQVADSNALGGDTGAFYLPFLLDPQNPSSLILGTCRLWRGASTGGNFSLLSPDFETGGAGACSGNEINLVRSIAAGGPKDSNGYSQVIYAGTNGEGPLIPTTPAGGHVWVTTNADGGPLSWNDVTQAINPRGFPISSIALDSTDPLGNTAYVTIMGFHTSHVWKTTNAGGAWTDFSANLPDAPANAIVVDSGASSLSNGAVYVGTDVGVFASSTGVAAWTEVGTASGPYGFLPNVAVTSLQIFNSGGLKRLRAATYGRGIWEWNLITTPDFQLNVSNNPLTIFAAQTATFNGMISAINGYNSTINLSCTAGATNPPQNCTPNPESLAPTTTGASFAINASGSAGDYAFNLHALGADSMAVTHDFALTLHIVDFTLSIPSPDTISTAPGSTSASVSVLVSALGGFSGSVTLSCSNLPIGASCQFQSSPTVSPTNGNPASVNFQIAASPSTPLGTFPITIIATTPGTPAKTQTLTLVVSASPDYSLSIANPSLTASVNSSAQFNGTLTWLNGYSNAVTLSCGPGAPPTCTLNPATAVPSSGGTSFAVTVSSNISRDYSFIITGVGSDPAGITHSQTVTFTARPNQNFDFTMAITPASASVPVGQPTIFTLNVNPTAGSFPNNVSFACSKLPALTTCGFNPTQVGLGSENSDVTFTLATTAPVLAFRTSILATVFSALPIAGLICLKRSKLQNKIRRCTLAILPFILILGLLSCGGGLQGNGGGGKGSLGTPAGTYTITVTATCGSVTHTAQVSLTVTP